VGDADYEGPVGYDSDDRTAATVELLDQDKVWWPKKTPQPVALKSMTIEHRYNLLRWLERNAENLKRAQEIPRMRIVVRSSSGASDWEMGYHPRLEPLFFFDEQPADEWMNAKPLVIKLRKQLAKHERRIRREYVADSLERGLDIHPHVQRIWQKDDQLLWSATANGHYVHLLQAHSGPNLFVYPVHRELPGGNVVRGVQLVDVSGLVYAESLSIR
jgi:hypothetical protein